MTTVIKACTSCKKEKVCNSENFQPTKAGKYGFNSKCKECVKKVQKKYRSTPEYKEKHRKKAAQWRKENPEKTLEINRKSYNKNKERINEERRYKYHNDPEFKQKKIDSEKRYKESGRRLEVSRKPEQMEKARIRSRKRRKDPIKKAHDYKRGAEWRKENKEYLDKLHAKNRNELCDSYVSQTLGMSVKEAPKELIELKRTIIELKRELKANNVKIR